MARVCRAAPSQPVGEGPHGRAHHPTGDWVPGAPGGSKRDLGFRAWASAPPALGNAIARPCRPQELLGTEHPAQASPACSAEEWLAQSCIFPPRSCLGTLHCPQQRQQRQTQEGHPGTGRGGHRDVLPSGSQPSWDPMGILPLFCWGRRPLRAGAQEVPGLVPVLAARGPLCS